MQTMIVPPPKLDPMTAAEVRQSLADSQRLIASQQLRAAAVLLWSAFDAAIRISLTELGQRTDDPIWISGTAHGLCAQAVAYGVIDPEDRDVLLRFLPMRDAASHGGAEAIDADLLQEVRRFAERTLDEMKQ